MFFSDYRRGIILSAITALLVGMIIFFNDVNIQIRMREVKLFLQRSNRSDNSIDHIGLVMKYRMYREMYENRISSEEMNVAEVRVNSILAGMDREKKISAEKYRYVAVPVTYIINFIRYFIEMPRLRDGRWGIEAEDIEIAYYYERNKLYHRAIEEYQKILEKGVADRTLKAGVLLHQGYCYSILGDYDDAKRIYISVIKDYGDINVAVTAALLLRYIEGFRSEIERVMKVERDSVEKGEKLYRLIAYRESLEVLNRVEKTATSAEKTHIKYIKGRTYEELGNTERAIDAYQDIVMNDTSSQYAKDANRRIFIVGGLSLEGEKIRDLAMKNSRILNDASFGKLIEESERYSAENDGETGIFLKSRIVPEKGGQKIEGIVKDKKIDMMIREVEERISGDPVKKNRDIPPAKQVVKIYTIDGNIFTGTVVSDKGGDVVVRTSLGDIRIEKSRISRRINL